MKKIKRITDLVESIVPAAKDVEDHVTRQHVSQQVQKIVTPDRLKSIRKDIDTGNSKSAVDKLSDLNDALQGLENRIGKRKK